MDDDHYCWSVGSCEIKEKGFSVMENNCRFFRPLFGAFLFLGIIWFSFIGVIDNNNASPAASRGATDMQWKLIGREKQHVFHWHSDFHSVSKRRVPNGPDPIHNRRVENSKQPPIRA